MLILENYLAMPENCIFAPKKSQSASKSLNFQGFRPQVIESGIDGS